MITLLTDYGHEGPYVGVLHGVIRTIAPDAAIIDVSHTVEPYDVAQASLMLADAIPYLPLGVHVAVVDPGVGTARQPIALGCADGRHYVGPDNGILLPAATRSIIEQAVALTPAQPGRSATFDGRDVFAPAAAELATGAPLDALGEPVDPLALARTGFPEPELTEGGVRVRVSGVDRFGTLQLACRIEELDAHVVAQRVLVSSSAREVEATRARTFEDVARGELILYLDSFSRPALAVREGSAAGLLGVDAGDAVILRAD